MNGSKADGRKTPKPKRRNRAEAQPCPLVHSQSKKPEVGRLTHELNEAREQQTATSEVLQASAPSQGKLDPFFEAMLTNATRICEAKFGFVISF